MIGLRWTALYFARLLPQNTVSVPLSDSPGGAGADDSSNAGTAMAETAGTKSRRSALRFSGFDSPVSYKTDYEDGQAALVNISTSGCAIRQTTTELQLEQRILVTLLLDTRGTPLQARAVVIRANTDSFALQFQHPEEDFKRRIVRYFARENRRRKNEPASGS